MRTPGQLPNNEAGAAMSHPPEHPGNPHDPYGGNPNPGDYPPPPGYRPPPGPPPGYGPPPGKPQPGYGPPPGSGFSIGEAWAWAWNKFKKNLGPLVLAALVYGVIGVIVHGLVFVLLGGATTDTTNVDGDYGASFQAGLGTVGTLVLSIVTFVFGIFVQAGFLSGGLDLADGRPVTVGSFFQPRKFGTVVLAGALLSVISSVLDLLSLPGLMFALLSYVLITVFTFFALFTIAFATDRGLAPIDALKASFTTVRTHVGETLVSYLVQGLLVVVGILACGVGILATGPIAVLIQVYTYRRLSGGPIAPATP